MYSSKFICCAKRTVFVGACASIFTAVISLEKARILQSKHTIFSRRTYCQLSDHNSQSIAKASYLELTKKLKEIDTLNGIQQILEWDEMVNLPAGSADLRNNQKALLSKLTFERQTSKELKSLIEKAEIDLLNHLDSYSPVEVANIRDAKRDYLIISRKSEDMAVRETELNSIGYQAWVESKKKKDFLIFQKALEDTIALKIEVSKATRPNAACVYDGCLDHFERGITTARLTDIFSEVSAGLSPLIAAVKTKKQRTAQAAIPELLSSHPAWTDLAKQRALCDELALALGFDLEHGRLDESVHPFTGGVGPHDVRITTRYSSNWLEGVAGVAHEVR